MNKLLKCVAIFSMASLSLSSAFALEVSPVIPAPYGTVYKVDHAAYMPQKTKQYKAVFTITKNSKDMSVVNDGLVHLAKIINLYASEGVPTQNLQFVAAISGQATEVVLNNEAYVKQFGVNNPNLKLIDELTKAHVTLVVCGQAWHKHHYQPQWLNKNVSMALSTLTTVIELQSKGFAVIQF